MVLSSGCHLQQRGQNKGQAQEGLCQAWEPFRSCLSPTPWLQKASIELALHWAAAPAGQGLKASLWDKTTKSWKELPLFVFPLPSSPTLRRCRLLGTKDGESVPPAVRQFGENQVQGERSEREKERKLSSLCLLPPRPCYGARQGLRLPERSGQDNRGLTPPRAGFQPLLLFLLSTPTLQGAPQIRTRAAPASLRCYPYASLGCIWTRDGEMAALRAGRA